VKPILDLNAFDAAEAGSLGGPLERSVRSRRKLFGAASVLFYAKPLEFVRGRDCWLYTHDGVAYLDAYNNVPSVGHAHPKVVDAATQQLRQLNIHSRYVHSGVIEYSAQLLTHFTQDLSNITFTCTGSESNDLALRMAAAFTGGEGIIVTESAYHGNTALTTAVSPSSFKQGAVASHVRVVPAPDARLAKPAGLAQHLAGQVSAAIEDLAACGHRLAAFIADSIFSSDGVFAEPAGFLRDAIRTVHAAGGLFIADEVQPGFGRTGEHMWGYRRHGVQPDVVTLGKPMGNGYPMGAVITRPEILDAFCTRTGYFNTFAATPVAAAVGQAVLDVIRQEDLMPNAARVGAYLKHQMLRLATHHPRISAVRGVGLYVGVELDPGEGEAAAAALTQTVVNGMRERRVLIGAAGRFGNVLKVRPPLTFSSAHVDVLVAALDETLRQTP
jgi:4-aminobutyrate aminotransferase-like enzyme